MKPVQVSLELFLRTRVQPPGLLFSAQRTEDAIPFFFGSPLLLQIGNAVVVARILNATLVVPRLDTNDFWNDSR